MAGKRRSIHVEGIQHGAPIPMGALVGNVLFSSGIMGTDPATGKSLKTWLRNANSHLPT